MSDWLGKLNDKERREWDEFVDYTRTKTIENMANSAFVMSLVPEGKSDIKFSVELGLAIMMDKPILIVARKGVAVPEKLRKVADEVVELTEDLDTEAGQVELSVKIRDMSQRLR